MINLNTENSRTAFQDPDQILHRVGFQLLMDAKPGTERGSEIAFTGGRCDQCELWQVNPHRSGIGARVDQNIDLEILHGGVEVLFDHPADAVNFIDKEDIPLLKFCQKTHEILGLVEDRTTGRAKIDAHLSGNQTRECRLPQTRHPGEQGVIEGISPLPGRLQVDLEIVHHGSLTDKFCQVTRANLLFYRGRVPGNGGRLGLACGVRTTVHRFIRFQ